MMNEDYCSPEETAQILNVSIGTLENWRWKKKGPPYYKPEGRVYYLRSEVLTWIESGRIENA